MKRYILFALFCFVAGSAFGQYPANPNKIRLGNQTSGDGLVYRGSGAPAYTPTDAKNAWVYIDSVAGRMYTYRGGAWEFVSAGAGVDSLAYRNDSLFVYSPDTTFYVVIDRTFTIAGSAGTPQAVDPGQTVTISNGFGITTTAAATRTVEVKSDTAAIATKTYTTNALALKLNLSDTATMLAPYQRDISLTTTGTSGAATFSSNVLNIPQYQAALTNPVTGTGTSGKVAKFTGTSSIGNGIASDDGTRFSLDDASTSTAKPFDFDSWTTAARPAIPMAGDAGWNITNTNLDLYSGSAWENPVKSATATGLGNASRVFYANANGRAITDKLVFITSKGGLNLGQSADATAGPMIDVKSDALNGADEAPRMRLYNSSTTPSSGSNYNWASIQNWVGNGAVIGEFSAIYGPCTGAIALYANSGQGVYFATRTADTLIFATYNAEAMRITPTTRRIGINERYPQRLLHVTGEARITDLTTDTPTRLVGADADGDLGQMRFGSEIGWKTGDTLAILQQGATSGQALAWNGSNWRPTTISASVSDGDKGDITVTSGVWNIDADVIGTTELADGAVASANLADQSAGGSKLGGLTYIPVDDASIDLSNYLTIDWISGYSQLVVWLRIGTTATRTVTLPTPSSTYAGKVVEIFFGDTTSDSFFGQIASGTNRITYRDGTTVATTTTYDGGQNMKYAKLICMQDPNSLAYQWVIIDSRI